MFERKRHWLGFSLLAMAACFVFLVSLANEGCKGKTPVQSTFVATATPALASNIISNLEDGSLHMNSVSFPDGVWYASTWDLGNIINSNYVTCGNVGANGTDCAIHLFGNITDYSDGQYPSFQLEGILSKGYYDGSAFSGVNFYYKTGTADTCSFRRFNLVIAQTQQDIKGGTCPSNCFDHYGYNLNETYGVWKQAKYYYNTTLGSPALSRNGWGYPTGITLSGIYLKQIIELQWQFGRNGTKGTSYVDYWVDEVEFF